MKSKTLILIVSLLSFLACKSQRPEPNFYENLYTGEVLNKSDYNKFVQNLHSENIDTLKGATSINLIFYSLITSNDSIIQPFKYEIRIGDEYIKRTNTYEKIGLYIPPKTFACIDGGNIQIGGKQSKPTFINLWFVACPGCVQEMPDLNELQKKYADKMNFVAMTFENANSIHKFLLKKDFNFKHISDADNFIKEIGTKPYPENILINTDGKIQYIEGGVHAGNIDYFETIIKKITAANKLGIKAQLSPEKRQ